MGLQRNKHQWGGPTLHIGIKWAILKLRDCVFRYLIIFMVMVVAVIEPNGGLTKQSNTMVI